MHWVVPLWNCRPLDPNLIKKNPQTTPTILRAVILFIVSHYLRFSIENVLRNSMQNLHSESRYATFIPETLLNLFCDAGPLDSIVTNLFLK